MKKTNRIIAIIGIVLFLMVWMAYLAGARINRTYSLPRGLYWLVDKPPERGDIVSFWPQDIEIVREAVRRGYLISGSYNGGYGPLLKKLMALPGDVVSFTDDGVIVNGILIANTKPFLHDRIGDPLPVLRFDNYTLRENEVLFLSDHLPRSFDCRYLGIQDMRQIIGVHRPILVW